MTIAAGFLYSGGLALCTDTQFTGIFKIHGTKLLSHEYDDGSKSVFATVGHATYSRMCVQLVQDQIADTDKRDRTLSKMHLILIAGVKALHQEHLFKHPDRADIGGVQFLVGFWSAKDRALGFYSTEETAVQRLYGYLCLGTGQLLGDYLLRPKYKRRINTTQPHKHSQQEVLQMARDALSEIKQHDPNVGGDSQFVTLSDDGELSPIQTLGVSPRVVPPIRKPPKRGRQGRTP